MNKVFLMGRLTAEPELKFTQSGKEVLSFSLAVDSGYGEKKKTDFITCVAWEGTAKFISQWFHKGSLLLVEGALRTRKYTDKSGNNRTATEVLVSQGHFTGEKSNRSSADGMPEEGEFSSSFAIPPAAYQAATYNAQLPPPQQMGMNDFSEVSSDDEDLPF